MADSNISEPQNGSQVEQNQSGLIDYSNDNDVTQTARVSDAQAIAKDWTDGKVAGESSRDYSISLSNSQTTEPELIPSFR